MPCRPNDCTITFKLASTGFGGTQDGELRYDRQGACFSYRSFIDLLDNSDVTSTFIAQIRDLYEKDAGRVELAQETLLAVAAATEEAEQDPAGAGLPAASEDPYVNEGQSVPQDEDVARAGLSKRRGAGAVPTLLVSSASTKRYKK